MPTISSDPLTIATALSAFGLVFAAWTFIVLLAWSKKARRHRELRERLDPETNQSLVARELRLWHEGGQETTTVYDYADRRSAWERFAAALQEAGIERSPATVVVTLTACALGAAALGLAVSGRAITAIFGVVATLSVFWWYMGMRKTQRLGLFERQLVDALELSARALRAGHPLLGSFQLIANEVPKPVGSMFSDVCQEHELGVDVESALRRMTAKVNNADLRLFSASLSINIRSGGNLAEVIDGIAKVVRDRMRLQRKFRVLSAQTQISKRILTGMPILMFFVLNVLNPDYMEPLYSTGRGNLMLAVAAVMLWSGWWIMNRMAMVVR